MRIVKVLQAKIILLRSYNIQMSENFEQNSPLLQINGQIRSPPLLLQQSPLRKSNNTGMENSLRDSVPNYGGNQAAEIIKILKKAPETRKQRQSKMLLDYALEHKYFEQLGQKISQDFVKIILNKFRDIVNVPKDTVISRENEKINYIHILLFGKMSKIRNTAKQNLIECDPAQIYEKLGLIANTEVKQLNRLIKRNKKPQKNQVKLRRRPSISMGHGQYLTIAELMESSNLSAEAIESLSSQKIDTQQSGVADRAFSTKYLFTTITDEESYLLRIPITDFLLQYNTIISKKIELMLQKIGKIPCFANLDKQMLEVIILSLSHKSKVRGAYVYHQKDQASNLYFLMKGEIKMIKNSKLFQENPNQLYMNRLEIMLEQQLQQPKTNQRQKNQTKQKKRPQYELIQIQKKKADIILPYANLTSMFNYHPKNKNIDLGTITSFCLFGQQELIDIDYDNINKMEYKERATDTRCQSVEVQYYEISIKRIIEILGKNEVHKFMKGLKQYSVQKIIRRQSHYAQTINFENIQNMNYFYGDENSQKNRGTADTKFRISKVNKKFIDSRNTIDLSELKNSNKGSTRYNSDKMYSSVVQPTYTTFNFHQLTSQQHIPSIQYDPKDNTRQSKISKFSRISENRRSKASLFNKLNRNQAENNENPENNIQANQHDQSDYDIKDQPEAEELKIMNMTHTWKLVKKRVDEVKVKSIMISPYKHQIGVYDPLIDNEYLRNSEVRKVKVQRQIRKDRITIVKKKDNDKDARNKQIARNQRILFSSVKK